MNNLFPTSISPDAAALDILERMPVMEHDDIEDKLAFAISSHGMNDEDINRLCSGLSYRLFIIEKEHEHFLDFTHQYNGLFAVKKKGYVKSVLDCSCATRRWCCRSLPSSRGLPHSSTPQ